MLSGGVPYEVATPYTSADVGDLVFVQEADVMYIVRANYPPKKLERLADNNWALVTVAFAPATVAPTGLVGTANFKRRSGSRTNITWKVSAVGAGGAQSAVSAGTTEYVQYENDDGTLIRVSWNAVVGASLYRVYRTDGSVGVLVETTNTTVDLRQDQYQGDGTAPPGVADPGAPATPTGIASVLIYGKESLYAVSAISGDTGEESLPSAALTLTNDMSYKGNRNELSWTAVAGASAYIIYRNDNGSYGYIGRSETTTFTDENIVPDLADGPQTARNPFVGAGNYPRCVTFVEQRLGLFSTLNDPQAAYMSQSANYENFGVASTEKAIAEVTFS
ncbi:hypothetical protein NKI93_31535, partial [Mesorhizobium sp. M0254]